MTVREHLILFSRQDCHLCELAAGMLKQTGVRWRSVDIDSDPELVSRYGLRVPVVMKPESENEWCFPFNDEQLARFIEQEP